MAATRRADQRPDVSACPPPSMSTISMPKWRACSTRPSPCSSARAPRIVQVELPDQRQLTAACQLVLAVEAAAFHKRWLIERSAGLRPAGPDAAAERARDSRRLLSRSDALARPGAGGASRGDRRRRCGDRAGGAGRGAHHRRERCRQQPGRRSRDPAADALHPPDQLSRPAVAGDPLRLYARRSSRRHAADRPLVRRSHAAADRRGVPARHRFPRPGAGDCHDQARRDQRPQHSLHRRAHRPCRERSQPFARRRRGARPARRVRFGQERDLARADAAVAEEAHADLGQRPRCSAATCWRSTTRNCRRSAARPSR